VIDYIAPLLAAYDNTVTIDVRDGGGRHVRLRRIGGTELTPGHDLPTIDVMAWHDDDQTRTALAMNLRAWPRAANNDPAGAAVICYMSTFLGPRQLPDPADATKSFCMFTVSMIVRRN